MMKHLYRIGWVCLLAVLSFAMRPGDLAEKPEALKYYNAPLDILLEDYSVKTGRTLLLAPNLPSPTFTLTSQGELEPDEYLQAIETLLAMHEIGLITVGERFIQVVPIRQARRTSLEIREDTAETLVHGRTGELVSQLIQLSHVTIAEATKAIDPLRHEFGTIHPFERTNALLVTDSAVNIQRMLQVLRIIDQPAETREDSNIIQIRYARATEIKAKLEELIRASQEDEQQRATAPRMRDTGAPGPETRTAPPGVIRARPQPTRTDDQPDPRLEDLIALAERGIIRGRVHIVADDRTNQLIIITRPENMTFFNRVIEVLDIATTPDVIVEVIRLDFADAEQTATMLNNLIGATAREDDMRRGTEPAEGEEPRAVALREFERRVAAVAESERRSKVGELSRDNITILSDQRTNSLIIMARRSDLETMREIIRDMDRMLAQVLIEAVIIEVSLDDTFETGVSWIQKSMVAYNENAAGRRTPIFSFAGGGGGGTVPLDATGLTDPARLSTSGLGYYFTLFDLNINAVLRASASDTRSRVVSTPVLLTTDNEEATLTSTERIYVFEGTTFVGTATDSRTARYRQEDVGLTLTVKPQINENHVVMMQIRQEFSEPGDTVGTDTDNLTGQRISINRTLEAKIAVRSGQTIVLGGQVRESASRRRDKVPLLGDIPVLGRLFSSNRRSSGRTETIVFITPYVLDSPEAAYDETVRRRDALDIGGMWQQGWSGSELAEPPAEGGRAPRRAPTVAPGPRPSPRVAPPPTVALPAVPPARITETFIRNHEDTWLDELAPLD